MRMKSNILISSRPISSINEVYLVLQNAHDDDGTFSASTVIYKQLAQCGIVTKTDVMIFHTVNDQLKSQLQKYENVKLYESLNNINQYNSITYNLNKENIKISFLYISAHGNYKSTRHMNSTLFGHFEGESRGEHCKNLVIDKFLPLFNKIKLYNLLTDDSQTILNSCYVGQTQFQRQ